MPQPLQQSLPLVDDVNQSEPEFDAPPLRRQRLTRVLLASTILGGSAALLEHGWIGEVQAATAPGAACSASATNVSGTNAYGGEAGYVTPTNTGYGGCSTNNTTINGQDGSPSPSGTVFGGGGGGAGSDGLTPAGTGGSGDNGNTAGGAGGIVPGQNGTAGQSPNQAAYGGGGGGGGNYGGAVTTTERRRRALPVEAVAPAGRAMQHQIAAAAVAAAEVSARSCRSEASR